MSKYTIDDIKAIFFAYKNIKYNFSYDVDHKRWNRKGKGFSMGYIYHNADILIKEDWIEDAIDNLTELFQRYFFLVRKRDVLFYIYGVFIRPILDKLLKIE